MQASPTPFSRGTEAGMDSEDAPLLLAAAAPSSPTTAAAAAAATASGAAGRQRALDGAIHIAFGQLLAVLICATGIFSKKLASAGISIPTTQSFANYLLLGVVWSGVLCWQRAASDSDTDNDNTTEGGGGGDEDKRAGAEGGLPLTAQERRWSSLERAVVTLADVEANYIVVHAYSLTTFTSVQLLDCASLPAAMLLSAVCLGRRYSWLHLVGAGTCVAGLGLLVLSDAQSEAVRPQLTSSCCLGRSQPHNFTIEPLHGIRTAKDAFSPYSSAPLLRSDV